jgi:hypothetical protein
MGHQESRVGRTRNRRGSKYIWKCKRNHRGKDNKNKLSGEQKKDSQYKKWLENLEKNPEALKAYQGEEECG